MEHVGIVKFDEKKEAHKKLSELSKSLHKLKAEGEIMSIETLELQVDKAVSELFGI
jgi:plasmid rolling circle replication initiator protein Rep